MHKKALVITYHLKNGSRIGGFHSFIKMLENMGYDIDWVTNVVSVSWLLHNNGRESARNFFSLWKGFSFEENGVFIRHFAEPMFLPAKLAKLLGFDWGTHYWPSWKRIRRRLQNYYDIIFVEGVACPYADDLKQSYPSTPLLYRPSDVFTTFCTVPDALEIEKRMLSAADAVLCVDEIMIDYYKPFHTKQNLSILRNPLCTNEDIAFLQKFTPESVESVQEAPKYRKHLLYLGASCTNVELIYRVAHENPTMDFTIIGPFSQESTDNLHFLGSKKEKDCIDYFLRANAGINPVQFDDNRIKIGYTRKVINYMKYLLPVCATNSRNYLQVKGFYSAENDEEFLRQVREAVSYSIEERLQLRDEYIRVLSLFLYDSVEKSFKEVVAKFSA